MEVKRTNFVTYLIITVMSEFYVNSAKVKF